MLPEYEMICEQKVDDSSSTHQFGEVQLHILYSQISLSESAPRTRLFPLSTRTYAIVEREHAIRRERSTWTVDARSPCFRHHRHTV